jgi:hypothetical protein
MALAEYLDSMDFTTLRKLILDMAPEDVDKSEGSFMYDAVTPIALFVSEMLGQMKLVLEQSFIGTATGTNLDVLAATMPRLYRQGALAEKLILRLSPMTQGIRNYIVNNQQSLQFSNSAGDTFKPDTEQSDWITNDATNIYIKVYKTVTGRGSSVVGQTMEPAPAIIGLTECLVHEISSGGGDAEDDDHFRVRIWAAMSSPFLGSVADYQRKIFSEFPLSSNGFNVENCFIIPRGSRSGYICIIPAKKGTDGSVEHCTPGELTSLQDYLDKRINKIGGYGMGVAPIGHVVKVRDFSEFKLHQRITVTVARGRMNEVNSENVRSQIVNSTNAYLRSIIDEVIPSSTNYMVNAQRYVNFFIYYYVNAHEYAVLSTLRDSIGTELIKNIKIERTVYGTGIETSYNANSFSLTSGGVGSQLLYPAEEDWNISEFSLSSESLPNVNDYGSIFIGTNPFASGRAIFFQRNGSYTGQTVSVSDGILKRVYDGYYYVPQNDLVIKSGDSKGTLPVLGELQIEIVEAEG